MGNSDKQYESNRHTSIDRRQFLKTAGQTGGFLSALVIAGNSLATPSLLSFTELTPSMPQDTLRAIEPSIKANFGSGFRVLSCRTQDGQTIAVIEHLENLYSVASSDHHNWQIIQSTEI